MSDLLTHLASRAVAAVPVVRPLIRSPYEPQATDQYKLPSPAIREVRAPTATQPRDPLAPGRDAEKIIANKDTSRPPHSVGPAMARLDETPPSIVAAPVQVAARLEPLVKVLPQQAAGIPVLDKQSPTQSGAAPVTDTHINANAVEPALSASVGSVTPSPMLGTIPITPNVSCAVVTAAEHDASAAATLSTIRPRVRAATQILPLLSPAAPTASQPPPQVTITIGRVEIRAAAPVIPAQSPASNNGPPLSLEAYLRRSANKSA